MTRRDFFKRLASVVVVATAVPVVIAQDKPDQVSVPMDWNRWSPAQIAFMNDPRPRVLWQGRR